MKKPIRYSSVKKKVAWSLTSILIFPAYIGGFAFDIFPKFPEADTALRNFGLLSLFVFAAYLIVVWITSSIEIDPIDGRLVNRLLGCIPPIVMLSVFFMNITSIFDFGNSYILLAFSWVGSIPVSLFGIRDGFLK